METNNFSLVTERNREITDLNKELTLKNQEISENNFELKKKLEASTALLEKIQNEKKNLENEHRGELRRWEETIKLLKQVINESDQEKKKLENELANILKVAEKCNKQEGRILELQTSFNRIQEEKIIESEVIQEEVERVLNELAQVRHEKEEVLSEKLILQKEIEKYRKKVAILEDQVENLNKKKDFQEIQSWCLDRKTRREKISSNRVYSEKSSKKVKDLINHCS
jgi:chromosome segregation ATPase